MELRAELKIPAIDQEKLQKLTDLIEQINTANNTQNDELAEELVMQFNQITNREFDSFDFIEYAAIASPLEMATALLTPPIPRVDNISRSELIQMVMMIKQEEESFEFYLSLLEKNLFYHSIEEIIFTPEVLDMPANMTIEEIVDKLLSFQPGQMT